MDSYCHTSRIRDLPPPSGIWRFPLSLLRLTVFSYTACHSWFGRCTAESAVIARRAIARSDGNSMLNCGGFLQSCTWCKRFDRARALHQNSNSLSSPVKKSCTIDDTIPMAARTHSGLAIGLPKGLSKLRSLI
jgi:hypothetical protein